MQGQPAFISPGAPCTWLEAPLLLLPLRARSFERCFCFKWIVKNVLLIALAFKSYEMKLNTVSLAYKYVLIN